MSPEFANAVDPIFLYVISTMEQVAAHQRVEPRQLQAEVQAKLRGAEERLSQGTTRESWELARYALCAWIDDVMINANWDGGGWWENHKLEFQYFKSNEAGTGFFQRAKQAEQLIQRDAIEVYYVAVILGFRGLFALPESKFLAQQFGLPNTIEDWTRNTAGLLRFRSERERLTGVATPVSGAPPLEGKFTIVGAAIAMLMLLVLTVLLGYHILRTVGS